MVSIICSECGGEARTNVAQCPRCGFTLAAQSSDEAASSASTPVPAPAMRRRNRAVTVWVTALAGIALWSVQTPGVPGVAVVAVGKVEVGDMALTSATPMQAASEVRQ